MSYASVLFGSVTLAALVAAASLNMTGIDANAPERWEHGWKTSLVTATRYRNATIGYNVGFSFPKNPNDCDRGELVDYIEAHGGHPYQMGGYPGAEILATFNTIHSKEDADRELPALVRGLSRVVASF